MGERIGRVSRQGVVLFALGVLVGALLLGGGSFALPWSEDGAQAQDDRMWQSKSWRGEVGPGGVHINSRGDPADPERFFDDWVETLPVECDLGPIFETGFDVTIAYRCP